MAWPTDHLTQAADHWETVGTRAYGVANQVWRDALSVDWQGDAADSLCTASHADMVTNSAAADQLDAAAKVARGGASVLSAARSRVRYAVDGARTADFNVGEDLSVTDRSTGGSAAQRAARQAQAQTLAGDIRQRSAQLVGLDQQVARKITTAVAGIRDTFPQNPSPGTPGKPQQGFGWDKAYWRHHLVNPNVFKDLISHSRPISEKDGTLVYKVPINRVHCTSGPLGFADVANMNEGRAGIPDGGQKGVISMYPLAGGSGVVEVQPGWTLCPPWVNKNVPID